MGLFRQGNIYGMAIHGSSRLVGSYLLAQLAKARADEDRNALLRDVVAAVVTNTPSIESRAPSDITNSIKKIIFDAHCERPFTSTDERSEDFLLHLQTRFGKNRQPAQTAPQCVP